MTNSELALRAWLADFDETDPDYSGVSIPDLRRTLEALDEERSNVASLTSRIGSERRGADAAIGLLRRVRAALNAGGSAYTWIDLRKEIDEFLGG